MKLHYEVTEDDLSGVGHGVEFHHSLVTAEEGVGFEGPAVAFLAGYAWCNGKSRSVTVKIIPPSSALLRNRERQPAAIIADVKEAIDLFVRDPSRRRHGRLTEFVGAWFNA